MADEKSVAGSGMFAMDENSYKDVLEIAKKEKKSVAEVTSEALKKHIDAKKQLGEGVSEKRLLID